MDVKIEESWKRHIGAEFDKPYFAALTAFVHEEYRRGIRRGGLSSTLSTYARSTRLKW